MSSALLSCFLFCKVGVINPASPPVRVVASSTDRKATKTQNGPSRLQEWNDYHGNTDSHRQRALRQRSCHFRPSCNDMQSPHPCGQASTPSPGLTLQPQAMSTSSFQHHRPSSSRHPPLLCLEHSLACSRGCPFPWSWLKCPASEASLGSWQYWLSTPHPLSTSPAHDLLLLLSCLTDGILSTAAASPTSQKLVGAGCVHGLAPAPNCTWVPADAQETFLR